MSKWIRNVLILAITVLYGGFVVRSYQTNQNSISTPTKSPQVAGVQTIVTHPSSPLTALINKKRISSGVSAVIEDDVLNVIAQKRATDMSTRNYYSHINPDGESFADLLPTYNLSPDIFTCENLDIINSTDVSSAVIDWSNSPTHNKCMNSNNSKNIGVAIAKLDDIEYSNGSNQAYVVVSIIRE